MNVPELERKVVIYQNFSGLIIPSNIFWMKVPELEQGDVIFCESQILDFFRIFSGQIQL